MSFVFSSEQLVFTSFFVINCYVYFNVAATIIYLLAMIMIYFCLINCHFTSMSSFGFCLSLSSKRLMSLVSSSEQLVFLGLSPGGGT